MYSFYGQQSGTAFGRSVSGAGDVNADGFDDLIVGNDQRSVRVFSGANGSVLYTFDGDNVSDFFGSSVSGAGDVNVDGFDDLIVGAQWDDNNGINSGAARVFSGADGSTLYTFDGDSEEDYFGRSVSRAGDVNADGIDDFIVGAFGDDNNGTDIVGFGSGSAMLFVSQIIYPLGDVNRDGIVSLLDVAPFIELLNKGSYQVEADINFDGDVDLLDVAGFVALVTGG